MKPILVNRAKTFIALAMLLSVAACGGGGSGDSGGGGGGGGGGATTYTVGGTVTGLSGTGFVLQNNGGDDLSVSGASFTFATSAVSGTAYSVTIKTQPSAPTQVCTVTNASGMIASSNITNVVVSCAPPTYTIGGTVSGLSGSGLVLRNNGGDDLPVPANQPGFTFATPLAAAAPYNVTIVTQPSTPAQVCTVTANGSGTVASSNITNVAITCTTTMTLLSSAPATGATGLIPNAPLVLRFSANLPSVSNAVSLTGPTGTVAISAAASAGNLLVVTPTSPLDVRTSYTLVISTALRGNANEQLAGPVTINFTTGDHQWDAAPTRVGNGNGGQQFDSPQFAFDKGGNALAVWRQQVPTGGFLAWWNLYTVAGSWGTAAQFPTTSGLTTPPDVTPQIAFDKNGNAMAVWQQIAANGTHTNIWSSLLKKNSGAWTTLGMVNGDNMASAQSPQIAFDPRTGDALAVWQQFRFPPHSRINENRLLAGAAGWDNSTSGTIGAESDVPSGGLQSPQIAFDNNGNALVVWEQYSSDGTHSNIYSSRLRANSGGVWDTPLPVNTDNGQSAQRPQIAFDKDDNSLVVWDQFTADGTHTNIWSSRLTAAAGSTWTAPSAVSTDNGNSAQLARIAIDSNGNALVVWDQFDGIWSARYVASAGNWTMAEQIGSGVSAQIAFDASGNALAVWAGTDGGIFSNHYTPNYTLASGWSAVAPVPTGTNTGASNPQIAFDAQGNAMAVWEQLDSATSDNVWSSRFDFVPQI